MSKLFKQVVKSIARTIYRVVSSSPNKNNIYIIPSYGRSGSTLLWHAVSEALLSGCVMGNRKASILERGLWDKTESIDVSMRGMVVKTHFRPIDINYSIDRGLIKSIYVISKPSDSIKSIIAATDKLGISWFRKHMKNLGAEEIKAPMELMTSDALNLKDRIYDWDNDEHSITIKYEKMWSDVDRLSKFIGREIKLPLQKDRAEKKLSKDEELLVLETYGEIDKLYDEFDPLINIKSQ